MHNITQLLGKENMDRCICNIFCISRFALLLYRRKLVCFMIALIGLLTASCSTISARLTYDFEVDSLDERLLYEPRTEDTVGKISTHLDEYIEQIETAQFSKFKDSSNIKIHFFNDKTRYLRFSGGRPSTFGSATTNGASISLARIRERLTENLCQTKACPETVNGVLLHELSHVHMRQYVGSWRYGSDIPSWFHEGLATFVSGGAGAGLVSEADAKKSILSGSHLVPVNTGSIFKRPATVGDFSWGTFHFYRQSAMFVEYLLNTNPTGFRNVLSDLRAGRKFRTVWKTNYDAKLADLWANFTLSL